ncbi:hypothetical protein GCM10011401_02120 [Nesterenkonia cremea]|uniref:Transcriptional regulator, AbiEi antitoxin, Type IV TA system n=2 Tax=Nesterenkonia cremea TaxID=1882340 RepID=A0A917EL28_9MICC|nr:hypothetical protein GCM10011401_02120 [Nesterenkonia cremea]
MRRRSTTWLSAAVARGELLRLRRGIFVDAAAWQAAPPWIRHRAEVAAAGLAVPHALLCRESALAVHGLPLLEVPREVQLRATSPSRAGLSRGRPLGPAHPSQLSTANAPHQLPTPTLTRPTRRLLPPVPRPLTAAEARQEYRSIRRTRQHLPVPGITVGGRPAVVGVEPLSFVLTDTVPRLSRAGAVVVLDAALAQRQTHRLSPQDELAQEEWLWSLPAQQAWRWAADFADGRSESPGESWSRLQIHELGFEEPHLQVEFQLPQEIARVDFDWKGVFGEFDGRVKYDDAGALSGLSDQQVYWNEKRREEQIEMVTGKRSVRWGWEDLRNPWMLEKKLLNRGVPRRSHRVSPENSL